jgi:hypothetical protein
MTKSCFAFRGVLFSLMMPLAACAASPADGTGSVEDPSSDPGSDTATSPTPASGSITPSPTSPTTPPTTVPGSGTASAELAKIAFGDPQHNGNGCPQGTGTVALSADHSALSVTAPAAFDATTTLGLPDKRKFCQAMVSFQAPEGIRLGIAALKLAGTATLSGTGSAKVTLEKRFPFGADDLVDRAVAASSNVAATSDAGVTWSECGGSSIAIISAALLVSGTNADLKGSSFSAALVAQKCQ